jgi:hypothetical protein
MKVEELTQTHSDHSSHSHTTMESRSTYFGYFMATNADEASSSARQQTVNRPPQPSISVPMPPVADIIVGMQEIMAELRRLGISASNQWV